MTPMAEISVIDVLRRGQASTDKLKVMLAQYNLPREVTHLLEQISGDFSEAIASSPNVVASPEHLQSTDDNGMYTNSSKKRRTQATPKLGGRKRADQNSCKVLRKSVVDGFTWRKYGQKDIFSSKNPRSYFRCTHKYDENCHAIRQVQQSEQHLEMFEITYFGEHTCKQGKKHCQEQENAYIINFNSNTNNPIQHFSSSPPLCSLMKQEHEEDAMSNQTSYSVTTSIEQEIPIDNYIFGDSFSMEFDGNSLDIESILNNF